MYIQRTYKDTTNVISLDAWFVLLGIDTKSQAA